MLIKAVKEAFKMANINKNELTKEQIEKAMACESAEELFLRNCEGV